MTPRQRFCAAKVLPNITGLNLLLDSSYCQDFEHEIFSDRVVAQTLCAAINLKSLVITAGDDMDFGREDWAEVTGFTVILGGCKMTKLVSLKLCCINFTEAEMTTFLQNSRGIRRMSLNDVSLTEGSWKSLFQAVKKGLPLLKSFESENLWGTHAELKDAGFDYEKYDPFTAIEQYLLGDGPDPFHIAVKEDEANEMT